METVEPPVTPNKPKSQPLMARLKEFVVRYGFLALAVHYTLFALCLGVFMLLIHSGFEPEGASGAAGTFMGAYLACQAIKIPRFAVTFALTPLLDKLIRRLRHKGPAPAKPPEP